MRHHRNISIPPNSTQFIFIKAYDIIHPYGRSNTVSGCLGLWPSSLTFTSTDLEFKIRYKNLAGFGITEASEVSGGLNMASFNIYVEVSGKFNLFMKETPNRYKMYRFYCSNRGKVQQLYNALGNLLAYYDRDRKINGSERRHEEILKSMLISTEEDSNNTST
ncbi:hypothetical protein RF11_03271 [Thelohanellus kitauei]|uniref:Uncharacterized protein n=1 Tax=Thelohanellus kitauei TaxID=669202 RepID=A0A0C2IT69_THEKT|nr:hypothetical protein RF11_03271 [Thelohanellus kitauei]